ncbi:MAG TPA: energy-coupling factor transporter transmembrane protein EcfT [Anaerolineae bacterium]|nr:energy-coupling factor transporter transmembrane protein EcfT [Anaerolineae bacterium]
MSSGFHPYAWTLWLVGSMAAVLLTRNPFYLAILLAAAGFLFATLARRAAHEGGDATKRPMTWGMVVRLALFLWGFAILFNALTVHVGERVLFVLPPSWPLIGGPITLEALIYGFITGLNFVALILIFAIYNSALGPQTVLRMIPGFAYQTGVAVSIAIAFIPQTLIAWNDIREAQRLRGHRVKGLSDFLPLFVSLLSYGLDRAIQLAESMDARGFGGRPLPASRRETWLIRGSAILGLFLLLMGLATKSYYRAASWPGLVMLTLGAALMGLSLWRSGRRTWRTRYRRWRWRPRDAALAAGSGLFLAAIILLTWFASQTLFYYPYPPYPLLPDFNPLLGLLFILPLLPALLLPPAPRSDIRDLRSEAD